MPVFSIKLPYRVRCQLPECGKTVYYAFKEELDGVMCTFCSPQHAHIGEDRWNEKKEKNIQPQRPVKADDPEFISGNTDELIDE